MGASIDWNSLASSLNMQASINPDKTKCAI